MLPAVAQGRLRSQHVEGGRKDIGQSGGRGDRRGRQHPLGGPAAPRIENVAIPPSLMAKRLELGPRSAQRPVAQPQFAEPLLRAERVAKADQSMPAGCAEEAGRRRRRRAVGQDAAVSAVDEKILDAVPQERFAAAIDGETLADAAEIQPHARLEEADRPAGGVQFDQMAADAASGLRRGGRLRGRRRRGGRSPRLPTAARR